MGVCVEGIVGWGGSVGNNLQMKNNPFRSNAISGRADGQTEVCSAVWLQREGGQRRTGKQPGYERDRGQVGEGEVATFSAVI